MAAVKEGIRFVADLMASVGVPLSIDVHCGSMRKGIDNYHVDVRISDKFILLARTVIAEMVKRGNRRVTRTTWRPSAISTRIC